MSSNPKKCTGCLLPPCSIHGKHDHNNLSSSRKKSKKSRRKSDDYRLKLRKPTSKGKNVETEKATTSAQALAQRSLSVLQVPKNSHQSTIQTENTNDSQSIDEKHVGSSTSLVSEDRRKILEVSSTNQPQSDVEDDEDAEKKSQRSFCVVHPFSQLKNIVNPDSSQIASQEVPSNPSNSSQGVQRNSSNVSHERQNIHTLHVCRHQVRLPIVDLTETLVSRTRNDVNSSNQEVPDSSRAANPSNLSMQQRSQANQVSRNGQILSAPNLIVPQETQRSSSHGRRESLNQVQSGQLNSISNTLNVEQSTAAQEIERMNFERQQSIINAEDELRAMFASSTTPPSISPVQGGEPADNEQTQQAEQNQSQLIRFPYQNPANQELLPANNEISSHSNYNRGFLPCANPGICPGPNRPPRDFPQSNPRDVVNQQLICVQNRHSGPSIANNPVGISDFPEHPISQQLIQEIPIPPPEVAHMPNWHNIFENSRADMRMPREYNMMLNRDLPAPHHRTSTIVSDPVHQCQLRPSSSSDDDEITQGQTMQSHNTPPRSNQQPFLEWHVPFPYSSTDSSDPYHNNSQRPPNTELVQNINRPMGFRDPYQNYPKSTSNTELVPDRYGPTNSDSSYQSYSQRSSSNETVPHKYRPMVSDDTDHNYAQRPSNAELVPERYGPTNSESSYQNYSQRSSNNETVPHKYRPMVSDDTYHNYAQRPFNTELVSDGYEPKISCYPYENYSQRAFENGPHQQIYRPTVSDDTYQNYSQRPSNTEFVAHGYEPMDSDSPYQNNSQRSSNNWSVENRYRPIDSGDTYHNYSQRPSITEFVAHGYEPMDSDSPYQIYSQRPFNNGSVQHIHRQMVSGDTYQNYSEGSCKFESIPERYMPFQLPFSDRYSQNQDYPMSQHQTFSRQIHNMSNHFQIYENQTGPGRYSQLPPPSNVTNPRMTREPMLDLRPTITNTQNQHQITESLSGANRYWYQPPPTSTAQQRNQSTNQNAVPSRKRHHQNNFMDGCRPS